MYVILYIYLYKGYIYISKVYKKFLLIHLQTHLRIMSLGHCPTVQEVGLLHIC